jgi:hypothetical protein
VMWIHANQSRQSCRIKVRQKGDTGEKGRNAKQVVLKVTRKQRA